MEDLKMIEEKARYKIESYYKKNNIWVLNKSEERILNSNKKYWIDAHKYDFSSSHSIKLNKNIMVYYESISPDEKHKITYTYIMQE